MLEAAHQEAITVLNPLAGARAKNVVEGQFQLGQQEGVGHVDRSAQREAELTDQASE
jgi:hypothetical protein